MVEQGPRRYPSAMERAAFLEQRAAKLEISVAYLLPPANIWKPRPGRKSNTISVYELAQLDTDMEHMPPPDLSTLLTEEERARPDPKLSPAELRKRKRFKPGIVSALELARIDTEGDEIVNQINLANLNSIESGDDMFRSES